jgi:hypothetical protein
MQEIYQEWAPFTLDFLRAYITPSNPRSIPDTSLIESTGIFFNLAPIANSDLPQNLHPKFRLSGVNGGEIEGLCEGGGATAEQRLSVKTSLLSLRVVKLT